MRTPRLTDLTIALFAIGLVLPGPAIADAVADEHDEAQAAMAAGDLDAAAEHETKALALARKLREINDPEIGVLAINVGTLQLGRKDHKRARAAFEIAVSNAEAVHGKGSIEVAVPLLAQAKAESAAGDHGAARATQERRIALVEAATGAISVESAFAHRDAAAERVAAKKFTSARKLLKRSIDILDQAEGDHQDEIAASYVGLAIASMQMRDRAGMQRNMKKGIDLLENTYEPGSPELIAFYEAMIRQLPPQASKRMTSRLEKHKRAAK